MQTKTCLFIFALFAFQLKEIHSIFINTNETISQNFTNETVDSLNEIAVTYSLNAFELFLMCFFTTAMIVVIIVLIYFTAKNSVCRTRQLGPTPDETADRLVQMNLLDDFQTKSRES